MKRSTWPVVGVLFVMMALCVIVTGASADTTSNLRIKFISSLYLNPPSQNSDIWVWEDPVTFKRWAVIGEYPSVGANLYIIDVSDPDAPSLAHTITNAPAFDVKVRYPYLYAVDGDATNNDGAIYDITNPASPVFVANMPSAHNITIADNGYMYLSYSGVRAFDLNSTPTAPAPIWNDTPLYSYYGHDVTAIGERMYDFNGWSQVVNVYDIAAFNANPTSPPVLLDYFYDFDKMTYTHNGWPSTDGNYLYVTDELSPSNKPDLLAWDISDIGNTPATITDTYTDENATIHNVMILGNLLYASYYSAGVRVFDISQPGTLKLIDTYDTSATSGDGFTGAWGIYSLFGDYFYVSDMENGLFIFQLVPAPSLWKDGGVAVASDAQSGKMVPASDPEPDYTVADGSGGAIILFDAEGGDRDIYAQRVDVNGNCLWGPNGALVVDLAGDVTLADAIPDDNGGVIVLWTDTRDTPGAPDAYVQWLDDTGAPRFAVNGLLVSDNGSGETARAEALHMTDGGQFIAVYTENSGPASTTSLKCQRYDDTGTAQWGSPARPALVLSNQQHADICKDGNGGFFIVWEDDRNSAQTDIYAQLIDGAGTRQYGLGGMSIATSSDPETHPRAVYVKSGDMTVAWTRAIDGSNDYVEAAEVSETGSVAWTSTMSTVAGNKRDLQLAFDGVDGVYAVWGDHRSTSWDIYAMHFHGSGAAVVGWPADGQWIAANSADEVSPTLAVDPDHAMVVGWSMDPAGEGRIHVDKRDAFASEPWPPGVLYVCANADTATSPSLCVDTNGDIIVAWHDSRVEGAFAHRIESSCGTLGGNIPPMISTITDTPGDGGGFVDITWSAAGQDGAGMVVQDYDVLFAENPNYGWYATGVTVAASGQSSYTATVPTAQDGTTTWYLVVANGGVSTCTWESFPMSGISQNDPPLAPQNLTVQQQGNYYNLTWFPPDPIAPDFDHYNVYRSTATALAAPAGGGASATTSVVWTQIGETASESFRDETATPGPAYQWTVTAVDAASNEGAYADPDTVTDTTTDTDTPHYSLMVRENFPNPFSRTTDLRLSLPDPADVTVDVFDVRGRRVAHLEPGRLPRGNNVVPFDGSRLASGVYFYRIRAGAATFTHKMVVGR